MKKLSLTILMTIFGAMMFAQAPEQISYQAIVRDVAGNSITNQLVGVRVAILQGSSSGPEVFAETHGPTTNSYGLMNIKIGTGSNTGPTLDMVDWSFGTFFVKIEVDPFGGTSYSVTSTSQLLSTPYALYAKEAGNVNDADADPTNEYNTGAIINADSLEITDGGGTLVVDLTSVKSDPDMDPNNEIQFVSKVGQIVTLSGGGGAFTDDVMDGDADPTNEFNSTLTLVGSTLQLSDGGGTLNADLSTIQNDADADPTNEYNTTLTLVGSTLQLTDGGGTLNADLSAIQNDADADPTNEFNTTVTLVGTDLQVTDGGGTIITDLSSLGNDADANPTNELQTLSQAGNIVTLSNGGGFVNINDSDADATNEFNTGATLTGTDLNISDGGGTIVVDMSSLAGGGDPSSTNELNTSATLVGTDLNITDPGGTIVVDMSPLVGGGDPSSTNELNTSATLVGTDLNITDPGGTIVVDMSPLVGGGDPSSTNELNTTATLTGTDLNITDPGGTIVVDMSPLVDDADADPTNEYNTSVVLSGTNLEVTDGGGTIVTDLSSLGGGGGGIKVGQIYQGGIVVFVDSTGIHGLICGMTDLTSSVAFEQSPNNTTEFATSLTDGAGNTATLVAAPDNFLAAQLCDAYSVGPYSDWYLPSVLELELLLQSNYVLGANALDWQAATWYWSSTEVTPSFGQNCYRASSSLGTIQIQSTSELNTSAVRPVRAF